MKVKDIMTKNPKVCAPDTTAAQAAQLMWDGDCGMLPVVENGQLQGVVTDRDMYIALATRNAHVTQLTVGEVATKNVVTCAVDDDVQSALASMKKACIRRLPVVGGDGTLQGIVSINDILLTAGSHKPVRNEDVVQTLQAICAHKAPVADVVAV